MNAKEKFLEAIIQKQEPRSPGVHVTDIAYPCKRKAWFTRQLGEFGTSQDVLTLWHGRMLHNTTILPMSELELTWNGITGRLDEYDKDEAILIDKKSIKKIFKSYLPKPEHVFQLECYNVLLQKNGHAPVKEARILYMEKETPHSILDLEVTKKLRSADVVADEMVAAKELILSKDPPPRVCNEWTCDYCSFVPKCFQQFEKVTQLMPLTSKTVAHVEAA